jgi:hypothetical protein
MGLETGSGAGGGAFESSHGVGAAVTDHRRMLSGLGMAVSYSLFCKCSFK